MAATKQTQTKRAKTSAPPAGWTDETNVTAGRRGEFFRFEPGAVLEGTAIGAARIVKSRFGEVRVRDVETGTGDLYTVAPKGFARRILDVEAGTMVRLEVGAAPSDEPGSTWEGRLYTRKADVPF